MDPAILLGVGIALSLQLISVVTAISATRYTGVQYTAAGRARELRTVYALNGVFGVLSTTVGLPLSLFYWVRIRPALARTRKHDRAINDAEWLENGRLRYASAEPLDAGDWAAALWSGQEAIGRLHAAYVRDGFAVRTPAPEDSRILMPVLHTLDTVRRLRRPEPAAEFGRHAAARLHEIARACHDAGYDSSPYLTALDRLRPRRVRAGRDHGSPMIPPGPPGSAGEGVDQPVDD